MTRIVSDSFFLGEQSKQSVHTKTIHKTNY